MYGYIILHGQFYKTGEIYLKNKYNHFTQSKYAIAIPVNDDPEDTHEKCYIKMSRNEGEVYQYRTVWLEKDDPELAKKLIYTAIKNRLDWEIETATIKYKKYIEALNNVSDVLYTFRED